MRAPYSMFNTHITTVKGLVSVDGKTEKMKVDVRFTSDSHETLSLTVQNLQIAVPFEKVQELIDEARMDRPKWS